MKKLGKISLIVLIVLLALFLVLIAPRTIGQADLSAMKGYHYAHRGYHDGNVAIAENSLASFQAAIDAGYGIVVLLDSGNYAVLTYGGSF